MITDVEIRTRGVEILATYLGDIEMERFIALIQRDSFDYTQWRQSLNTKDSIESISHNAMNIRNKQQN